MANFEALKTLIRQYIKENGDGEITGDILQSVLIAMVTEVEGNGYVYAGIATPTTVPVTGNVFYIATEAGSYSNFGSVDVSAGITILKRDGTSWTKNQISYTDGVFDISAYNGSSYADLAAALGTNGANVPLAVRKGGMSIKFVTTSDNKYVQARLMTDSFTIDVNQWQVVDSIPKYKSKNLAESGSVYELKEVLSLINYKDTAIQLPSVKSNVPKTDGTIVTGGQIIGRYDIPIGNVNCVIDISTVVSNYAAYNSIAAWALYSGVPSSANLLATGTVLGQNNDISVIVRNYPTAKTLSIVADYTNPTIQGIIKSLDANYLTENDVINSLDSNSTNKPLSAAKGKELNDKLIEDVSFLNIQITPVQLPSVKSNVPKTDGTIVTGGQIIGRYDIPIDNPNCVINATTTVNNYNSYPDIVAWALYSNTTPSAANLLAVGNIVALNNNISVIVKDYPTAKILSIVVDYSNPTIQVNKKVSDNLTENDVINSLDSNSTNKPLSAAQGKVLNGKFTTKIYITGGELRSQIPTNNGTLTNGAQVYGRKDYSLVGLSGVVYIESDADNVYSPEQWPTAVLFAIYDSSNHFIVAGDLLKDNIRQSSIDLSNYPNAALLRVTCSYSSGIVSVYTNEDKYASKEDLDELQNEVDLIKDSVSVELPSEIIMVKGARVELFTRAFVKCFNPYIYHIEPVCTIGKAYPRYILFKVQNEWVGHNYTLTINVRNNDGKIIATGNTVIKVINKATSPASMKNVLVFGSSLMSKGYVASELKRRLTETSGDTTPLNPKGDGLSNISFVGRKVGSKVDTIHQEGTGGWSWEDYAGQGREAYRFYVENVEFVNIGDVYSINGVGLTVVEINLVGANEIRCTYSNNTAIPASGTLTKVSGEGDATITYTGYDAELYNPFYNNGGLDFANYADLYCNGHIDYLIGYTGTGLVGQSNAVQQTINNVKAIADAYHADFPNGKFLIVSQALPDPTGGMGADYGCSASNNYYNYAKVVWEVAAAFDDLVKDDDYKDFVVLVPNTQQFDCEYSYPSSQAPVNNRSSETVRLGQNGLHPIETGEYQVSDSIYSVMHQLLSL